MITEKAEGLSREFKAETSVSKQEELSWRLFEELTHRCQPTEEEFMEIMTMEMLTPRVLFRILTGKYLRRWAWVIR